MSVNWNPNDPENPKNAPVVAENNPAGTMAMGMPVAEGSLGLVVIRANGDTEDLGIVSYYHENAWKQAQWEMEKFGEVQEETLERLKVDLKNKAPYILAGVASLGLISFAIIRKLR